MHWEQLCNDPQLANLPYKVETDALGKLILSPAKTLPGARQSEISGLLRELGRNGIVITECAVETADGIKVADVAWLTREHWRTARQQAACSRAPAVCVEIWSGSNTDQEIATKRALYFQAGALEVWECDQDGRMRFFTAAGCQPSSTLMPDFPPEIALD